VEHVVLDVAHMTNSIFYPLYVSEWVALLNQWCGTPEDSTCLCFSRKLIL